MTPSWSRKAYPSFSTNKSVLAEPSGPEIFKTRAPVIPRLVRRSPTAIFPSFIFSFALPMTSAYMPGGHVIVTAAVLGGRSFGRSLRPAAAAALLGAAFSRGKFALSRCSGFFSLFLIELGLYFLPSREILLLLSPLTSSYLCPFFCRLALLFGWHGCSCVRHPCDKEGRVLSFLSFPSIRVTLKPPSALFQMLGAEVLGLPSR